jgi:pyruvate/2-oxoglutarate dehydrogenase complex dihydrolipoamide acyltransferase (E2) component
MNSGFQKKLYDLKTPEIGDAEKIHFLTWYVELGQEVREGQELFEIETDKASFTLDAPTGGRLVEKLVENGALITKNQILGRFEVLS